MLKIGTDFSGIGAPEQALKKLGIEHKSMFACDVDKYAQQSFLANYKTEQFYDDITTRNHKETPYVDLYVAGFPCQAFSMAGKRKGFDDTRGTLFFDLLNYLNETRPKYFILENVKGLISHDGGKTLAIIMDCLAKTVNGQYSFTMYDEGLNYYVYYKVLNTKDFGIPQNRERIFIVGFRDEKHNFKFPKKIPLELKLKDIVTKLDEVDKKYYLSKTAINKIERHKNTSLNNDISNTIHAGYYKMGGRDQQYISCNKISNDNKSTFRVTGCATRGRKRNGANQYSGELEVRDDELANTITTVQQTSMLKIDTDKTFIRRLTPLECLRLQGFPDSFYHKCKTEGVSDTQLYKQAGNSMTVNVMSALINEILKNENNGN